MHKEMTEKLQRDIDAGLFDQLKDKGATTNAVAPATTLTGSTLASAMEAMKNLPPKETVLHRLVAGREYWKELQKLPPMPQPPAGMFGGFMGVNIFVDDELEPDIMEARNSDGTVLETFRLEPKP